MKKLKEYQSFKNGDSVTCTWGKKDITDAKLSIDIDGNIFLCSNDIDQGLNTEDKKGYLHSWVIFQPDLYEDFDEQCEANNVTNLQKVEHKETLVVSTDEISSSEYDFESAEMIKNGAMRI